MTIKKTEQLECASHFVLSLNIPPQKLFGWFRRLQLWATSSWLAASSWQHPCSCIMSQAEFFGETSNNPGDSVPLQPRFGALRLLDFPKTKITFGREGLSDHQWDSGKSHRAADDDWERYVRSQGAYFEGDWGVIVLCTVFLVSCIFFNKCIYFS